MKKTRMLLAACGAALLMCAVPAFAGEADYTGDWYAEMKGVAIKMTLNEDGTYEMVLGSDVNKGTWEVTEDGLLMDGDGHLEITQDGLFFDGGEDNSMTFGREAIENFVPAEIDYEADLDLLQGKWSAYKVGADDAYLDVAPGDAAYMDMEIDGTTVTLSGFYFEEPVSIEMDNQDGGLFVHFDDESEMFELIAVNYLEDGTLRAALVASVENDEQIEYFFVPAEAAEEVTEAITE